MSRWILFNGKGTISHQKPTVYQILIKLSKTTCNTAIHLYSHILKAIQSFTYVLDIRNTSLYIKAWCSKFEPTFTYKAACSRYEYRLNTAHLRLNNQWYVDRLASSIIVHAIASVFSWIWGNTIFWSKKK